MPAEPLHRNADFRRLWIGEALSDLGTSASQLAFPLLVLTLTGSPFQAGLVGTTQLAVWVLLLVPAGALVDRWDRRRVMISCQCVRAGAFTGLGVAVAAGAASLPLILTVALVHGAAGALFGPAHSAALRAIVPTEQLPVAASREQARSYAAELAGPPLGGVLFGIARWAPFAADAVSYLASLIAIVGIRQPLRRSGREVPEPLVTSMRRGVAFVWAQPFLRAALIWVPISNVAMSGVFFAFLVRLQEGGLPPAAIGATQAVIMAGGLLGTFLAPWIQRRLRAPVLIIAVSWSAAVLVGAMAVLPGGQLIALPLLLFMIVEPAVNATFVAYQLATTPDELQGRVMGVLGTLSQSVSPLGPLLAGLLIEKAGGLWAFGGFALLLGLAAIYTSTSRGIRGLRPIASLGRDHVTALDPASAADDRLGPHEPRGPA